MLIKGISTCGNCRWAIEPYIGKYETAQHVAAVTENMVRCNIPLPPVIHNTFASNSNVLKTHCCALWGVRNEAGSA
jgi:hypothetical protein